MATLNDVAAEAGVSIASVSRYVNSSGSLSQEKAERIKEAINKLNYRIDTAARSLKTGRFYHIGIIAPATGPHYWEIISSLENTLAHSNYFTNLIFTREPKYNKGTGELISKMKNVDGTIIMPLKTKADKEIINQLKRQKEKFVIADWDNFGDDFYQIGIDNRDIGRQAGEILTRMGHTKLLYIQGAEDLPACCHRLEGFKESLSSHSIELKEERILRGKFDPEFTYNLIKDTIKTLPEFTAVFSANDLMALAFIKAASEAGLQTPVDFSIIGVDDLDVLPFTTPGLSTFRQPLQTMGNIAAGMLIAQIDGFNLREKQVLLKAHYIERETVRKLNKS